MGMIQDVDFPVRFPLERRRVFAQQFAPPPISRLAFRLHVREPVLIDDGAHLLSAAASRKRIAARKVPARPARPFSSRSSVHTTKRYLAPRSKRSEPQIPFESRLIGRVNSRRLFHILRLVAERIGNPRFAVARALKFNFVARVGHHGKQSVSVSKRKGSSMRIGCCGKRKFGRNIQRSCAVVA